MPGKVDVDDVVQEASMGLWTVFAKYAARKPREEFDKIAKARIWRSAVDAARPYLTAGRDIRREVSGDSPTPRMREVALEGGYSVVYELFPAIEARIASPAARAEIMEAVESLIAMVDRSLSEDAGVVIREMIDPSPAVREAANRSRRETRYNGEVVSLRVIAEGLGWPAGRVFRAKKQINLLVRGRGVA